MGLGCDCRRVFVGEGRSEKYKRSELDWRRREHQDDNEALLDKENNNQYELQQDLN